MRQRRFFTRYKPPGTDSQRALAAAKLFLVSARTIDQLCPQAFARQHKLKPKTAQFLIEQEKQRRANG